MLIVFLIIFSLGLWYAWNYFTDNQTHPYIPKVQTLPLVGFLLQLQKCDYQQQLARLVQTHGKICKIRLGSYEFIWLNDHKLIREAFNNPVFCGRPKLPGIIKRTGGFSGGIIFNDGPDFDEQRRFCVKQLKRLGLGKTSMESIICEEVEKVVKIILQHGEKPMATRHLFNMASFNILWEIISGERYSHDDKDLVNLSQTLTRNMELQDRAMLGVFMPWLARVCPKFVGWCAYLEDANKIFDFWKLYAQKRIRKSDDGLIENDCFINMYIAEMKACQDEKSSFFGEKGATLQDLFIAGTETSSTTLCWLLLYAAVYEEYQNAIFEEIRCTIGDRITCLEDKRKMPMTEAFILETMRHTTLAPLGMIHSATKDASLDGIRIPKGSLIHANLCAAHNNPQYWENSEVFHPERFISYVDERKIIIPDCFLAFSHGKRKCPGEMLARNELFLFLVGIIKTFKVKASPLNSESILTPKLGISATPRPHLLEFLNRY